MTWSGWLWLSVAWAGRPDAGTDIHNFDGTDTVAWIDGPAASVRVWYSTTGTNETRLTDSDTNGVPDFAEEVAEVAEDVLVVFANAGFRPPLRESEVGLGKLGGTDAFDIYLVDFAGTGDGHFSTDGCDGSVCAGHLLIDNDFGTGSDSYASQLVRVLASHEMFHGVQAAYRSGQPSWISEGSATWAEHLYDPGNSDFLGLCGEYLADTERPIDSPPTGFSVWSYGTGLFFAYLHERLGVEAVVAVQEEVAAAASDEEELVAVQIALERMGTTLQAEWPIFSQYNLAAGYHSGETDSYSFADGLRSIAVVLEGSEIVDDQRFYPWATTAMHLEHPGGDLFFATPDDPTGLWFAIHPVADGDDDGPIADALWELWPTAPGAIELGADLPAGGYWIAGGLPDDRDQSIKIDFCFGADVSACLPVDTASPDTADTGLADDGDGDGKGKGGDKKGCGCVSAPTSGLWWLGLAPVLVARRRPGSIFPRCF